MLFDFKTKKKKIKLIDDHCKIVQKNNDIIKNIMHKKNNFWLIKLLLIFNLFLRVLPFNNINSIEFKYSNITLKVNGIGDKKVFNTILVDRYYYPNEIYINGKNQNEVNPSYNLNQTDNIVNLIWNNDINSTFSLFYSCPDITEIDLSDFNSSQLKNTAAMFADCYSLVSINFNNFDTSQVTLMYNMFGNCISLISLDLSNFDTSLVETMENMFNNCTSLTSLNLSTFNISKVTNMQRMFSQCINLEYINLLNFNKKQLEQDKISYIFNNIPDNIVICINGDNTGNNIFNKIKEKSCNSVECSNDWRKKQKKLISKNNTCVDNCTNNGEYKYEYNGKCYKNCPNGLLFDDNNICKCELEQCSICSNVSLIRNLCTKCNTEYFPIENDHLNLGEYINCYKNPEGYYLDLNDSLYKKCFERCETCEIKGNNISHNCLQCNNDFPFDIKINNYSNCYKNCSHYYYFDNQFNFYCTESKSCPEEYPKLLEDKNECVVDNKIKYESTNLFQDKNEYSTENKIIDSTIINTDKIINAENDNMNKIKDFLKNSTLNRGKNEEIKFYDDLLEYIENYFTSKNYNKSKLEKGKDEIIETEKMKITLTTSENQKNNRDNNVTTLDLADCELSLRKKYNLINNETLYIKKIDINQEGMRIPKIEYDIYYNLSGIKLEKLNTSICYKDNINLFIPLELTENIESLNSTSGYFNDICYTTTSESGTDISLNDRKNEFINNNKAVCQEDCEFSEYDAINKKVKCSCDVKQSSESFAYMYINKTKLYENLKDFKNIANIKILKCFNKLMSGSCLIKNIGSYIIIVILIFHIITIFIFYLKQLREIKNEIKEINLALNNFNLNVINTDNKKENNKKFKKNNKDNNKENNKDKSSKIFLSSQKSKIKGKRKNNEKNKKENKKGKHIIPETNNDKNIKKPKINNKKDEQKAKKIMQYKNNELNDLPYELALQYDKRTYCEYYIALLQLKHQFLFSFCNKDDYNSSIIKMDLFFISFSIFYVVNALFYNDDTMHNIYINKGSFDLEYQLPISIYSSLISMVLNKILELLALISNSIIEFKREKEKENLLKRKKELNFKIKIKSIFYFLVSFIFLICFWYYISMFGIIYKNTQMHLLKDTLISFGLSLIYPFGIHLVPGIFRIPSLADKKNKRVCLFKFSKVLQLL